MIPEARTFFLQNKHLVRKQKLANLLNLKENSLKPASPRSPPIQKVLDFQLEKFTLSVVFCKYRKLTSHILAISKL